MKTPWLRPPGDPLRRFTQQATSIQPKDTAVPLYQQLSVIEDTEQLSVTEDTEQWSVPEDTEPLSVTEDTEDTERCPSYHVQAAAVVLLVDFPPDLLSLPSLGRRLSPR